MKQHHHQRKLEDPIFILGNPRSGTTMFRLMLTSHKNIVIPPECGFTAWLYPKYKDWNQNTDKSVPHRFVQDVVKSRKFETWNLKPEQITEFVLNRQPNSYPDAVSAVYEYYGFSQNRAFTRWGDKNNFYVDYIPTLLEVFPKACYVHLVRDGRNVACSYKKLNQRKIESEYVPRLTSNIEEIATEWKNNVNKIYTKLGTSENVRFCEIRFEDIVLNTESSLSKLCRWLGEDYDPSMSQFYRFNKSKNLEPKEFLPWKAKTLKPLIADEVDRYKQELSDYDRKCFEAIAGEELIRYHYPLL